ncbi:MAG: tRNA (adenosine(37)-N6)-threonylcarbamoyltransferase complex ATPase subunit type 1 TsaE [Kiritimatiellia bacterium]|nr:tRNA (adenosine(37)-N6)-threonylcarbamoyltransferase complex ATPase subunit type 1 TsaE [Kiritimatiellia bacterium]
MSISTAGPEESGRIFLRTTRCFEETEALGATVFKRTLHPGAVLALYGDLGAGKTCLVRGIGRGLGVQADVLSPSYDLIHEYPGPLPMQHIDLYRIRSSEEALDLGLLEIMEGRSVTVIEWAERAEDLLPPRTIRVWMEEGDAPDIRRIRIDWGKTR